MITGKDISDCFGLPCPAKGILPDAYRVGEEKAILPILLRPANRNVETNLKKGMLKCKYRLLLDIVQAVIYGITFSKDGITNQKIRILATLIDKARNINWVDMLKQRFLEENKKFFKIKATKKIDLKKNITMIHRVSMLLQEKMKNTSWEPAHLKKYVFKRKAMLTSSHHISGFADDDNRQFGVHSDEE